MGQYFVPSFETKNVVFRGIGDPVILYIPIV